MSRWKGGIKDVYGYNDQFHNLKNEMNYLVDSSDQYIFCWMTEDLRSLNNSREQLQRPLFYL